MIRQAQTEDYEAIQNMRNSLGIDCRKLDKREYRVFLQKNGFLLSSYLEKSDFEKNSGKLILVYEQESEILGYIHIDTKQEMTQESKPLWFQKDMESLYFSLPHADIAPVAVSPGTRQKGVGTALFQEAVKRIKQRKDILYVFSFVAVSPITNVPSLIFHEKMGFDRIAVTGNKNAYGLENYQSILYAKRLS
jgi:ribosomal protein S18 acetylase RimI-like enzyme